MTEIEAETLGDSQFRRMLYSLYTCWNGDFRANARKLCERNPAIDFEEVQASVKSVSLDVVVG